MKLSFLAMTAFAAVFFCTCDKEPSPGPVPPPPPVIHVEKVILPSVVNVGLRDSAVVKSIVQPENATDKRLVWSSADTTIVRVDSNGVVYGLKRFMYGDATAKVFAKSVDGGITAECLVKVVISEISLSADMVSSNLPMQYVCWGWTPDGDWDESLGNRAITAQQSEERRLRYALPENMWDGDAQTDYHVNFDVYREGFSWSIRQGARTEYPYIQFDLGETLHRINLYLTMSSTAWFDGHCGFRLEFSADGSTYLDLAEADRLSTGIHAPVAGVAGENIRLLNQEATHLKGDKSFRGFRIVPTHGYTSAMSLGYWGIAEIKVERVLL